MSRRPAVFDGSLPEPLDYRLPVEVSRMAQQDRQWQQERQDKLKEAEKPKQDPNVYSWIDKNYDPSKNLSGTVADPYFSSGVTNAKNKAYELAAQGATIPQIQMALSGDIDQLNKYSVTAKSIREGLEAQTKDLPTSSGYNKNVIIDKGLRIALLDDKGELKDMNTVDPTVDYMNLAISNYPLETTDGSVINEFVKDTFQNVKPEVKDVKIYNNTGGYTKKRMEVTAAPWQVFDVDAQGRETQTLVPKYETAYDNGKPITMNGEPVRMVTKDVYEDIMKKYPAYRDHIRGQMVTDIVQGGIKDENGEYIKLFSPQADQYARSLVYKELSKIGAGGSKEIISEKPTQIKVINNNSGSGKGNDENARINDLFKRIKNQVDYDRNEVGAGATRLNSLDSDAQTFILDQANKTLGKGEDEEAAKYGLDDLFLMQNKDGRVGVYKTAEGKIIGRVQDLVLNLSPVGTNIKNQPGAKEKREVIKQGNQTNAKTFNVINPKTGQVVMKGVSKEQAEAARKKGYNVQ